MEKRGEDVNRFFKNETTNGIAKKEEGKGGMGEWEKGEAKRGKGERSHSLDGLSLGEGRDAAV